MNAAGVRVRWTGTADARRYRADPGCFLCCEDNNTKNHSKNQHVFFP